MIAQKLTRANQGRLSAFIEENFGIRMPEEKRMLLLNRLARRVRELGLPSYDAYCELVLSPEGRSEVTCLANSVCTHRTEFFREPRALDYFRESVLSNAHNGDRGRPLSIWSVACSSGEEPYSVAMLVDRYGRTRTSGPIVLASDLSTDVLQRAALGVYPRAQLEQIRSELRRPYVLVPRDRTRPVFRIAPEIRRLVLFRQINLMSSAYPAGTFQVILCRNVLIYFSEQNKQAVLRRLLSHIEPGGHLLVGQSESLLGMQLPVSAVAPGVYQKS